MQKSHVSELHPDLVIDRKTAIDRMGLTATESMEKQKPNYEKQILLVRRVAKEACSSYRNCRGEDWCFFCSSGQTGPLYRGETCLDCKLLTADAYLRNKPILIQIAPLSLDNLGDQS